VADEEDAAGVVDAGGVPLDDCADAIVGSPTIMNPVTSATLIARGPLVSDS
jgi:hypothetical protein